MGAAAGSARSERRPTSSAVCRDAAERALEGGRSRAELVDAVAAEPGLEGLRDGLGSSWGTLLKPLAWQGVLSRAPHAWAASDVHAPRGREPALARTAAVHEPRAWSSRLPCRLRPATSDAFSSWMSGGFFGKRMLREWFASLGDRLAIVNVEGQPMSVLAEDLDDLAAAEPTTPVRLVPGLRPVRCWAPAPTTATWSRPRAVHR